MRISGEAKLVRIFIGESDRWQGVPLSEAIVRKVREMGLACATVIRGPKELSREPLMPSVGFKRMKISVLVLIVVLGCFRGRARG